MQPKRKKGNYGNRISEKQRKEIALYYVNAESYNATAKHYKISPNTVKAIVTGDCKDLVTTAMHKKKAHIDNFIQSMMDDASRAMEISNMYLEELKDPEKRAKTSTRDAATVYGILIDKQFKLEEIRLKRLETEIKKQELAALEKGVSIQINPVFGEFGKPGGNE